MQRQFRSSMHLLVTLLLVAAAAGCGHDADDGQRVVDPLVLLSDGERARVAAYHSGLLDDYDVDYRIVIEDAGVDIDAHANARFRQLAVGRGSRGGRGLLLVIDPVGNRVRLEVGGRLEGVITDAFTGYVEREQMVPFFREHRIADGVLATTELLVQQLAADPVATNDSADAAVARYFDAIAAHNANPELELYSRASRALLSIMPITRAQMDNVAREGRRCPWAGNSLSVPARSALPTPAPCADPLAESRRTSILTICYRQPRSCNARSSTSAIITASSPSVHPCATLKPGMGISFSSEPQKNCPVAQ